MISVIIPAHNEAAVIERCLRLILRGAECGEMEVLVVANGCTDDTAAVARRLGLAGVRVIETPVASKVHALNLGEAQAAGFPRVYVDADVAIDTESVRQLVRALETVEALAAAPVCRLDLSGCSAPVRRFYMADQVMPSHRGGIGGSGVYALSEAGRARFGRFPDVTADDGYVRRHFALHERRLVSTAHALVTPPRTLAGLIAIKTRSHLGNMELAERYPHLTPNRGGGNKRKLVLLAMQPTWWPAVATYAYVKLIARLRARRLRAEVGRRVAPPWQRDDSSRGAEQAGLPTPVEAS